MMLAGIAVRELADRVEDCYGREVKVLALDIAECETIIRALEAPPAGLEELRGVCCCGR